jgi:hypothetical protein
MAEMKSFEEMKEFIDGLYEPSVVKQNLKKSNGGYIWSVLELVKDEVAYKDISMLYDYYMENGSELIVKAITEYAYAHKLHDLLQGYDLSDEDLTGLADQAVSELLFYNRKGDDDINVERMEAFFRKNPNGVDIMVEKFRKSLEESVKREDLQQKGL